MAPRRIIERVEVDNYGKRLRESITLAVLGTVVSAGSIALLWWNEHRFVRRRRAIREAQRQARHIEDPDDDEEVEAEDDGNAQRGQGRSGRQGPLHRMHGQLVHLNGLIMSDSLVTDTEVQLASSTLLQQPSLLQLRRHVEMYQWVEIKEKTTENKAGGKRVRRTRYRYRRRWTSTWHNHREFQQPTGHENPRGPAEQQIGLADNVTFRASSTRIGRYGNASGTSTATGPWSALVSQLAMSSQATQSLYIADVAPPASAATSTASSSSGAVVECSIPLSLKNASNGNGSSSSSSSGGGGGGASRDDDDDDDDDDALEPGMELTRGKVKGKVTQENNGRTSGTGGGSDEDGDRACRRRPDGWIYIDRSMQRVRRRCIDGGGGGGGGGDGDDDDDDADVYNQREGAGEEGRRIGGGGRNVGIADDDGDDSDGGDGFAIGDIRIRYEGSASPQRVSILAMHYDPRCMNGGGGGGGGGGDRRRRRSAVSRQPLLVPYNTNDQARRGDELPRSDDIIYACVPGDYTLPQLCELLRRSNRRWCWALRILGGIGNFIGVRWMMEPVVQGVAIIPWSVVSVLMEFGVTLVALPTSLVVTSTVISLSWLHARPWLSLILMGGVTGGIVYYVQSSSSSSSSSGGGSGL